MSYSSFQKCVSSQNGSELSEIYFLANKSDMEWIICDKSCLSDAMTGDNNSLISIWKHGVPLLTRYCVLGRKKSTTVPFAWKECVRAAMNSIVSWVNISSIVGKKSLLWKFRLLSYVISI